MTNEDSADPQLNAVAHACRLQESVYKNVCCMEWETCLKPCVNLAGRMRAERNEAIRCLSDVTTERDELRELVESMLTAYELNFEWNRVLIRAKAKLGLTEGAPK